MLSVFRRKDAKVGLVFAAAAIWGCSNAQETPGAQEYCVLATAPDNWDAVFESIDFRLGMSGTLGQVSDANLCELAGVTTQLGIGDQPLVTRMLAGMSLDLHTFKC